MESVEGGKYGFVKMIMLDNETALKLLNINTDNRPLSKERSKSYKEMMDAYVWCVGADALVISSNNLLVNGQHRVKAKLESATEAIPVIVRYGVDWDEFTYIDKQRVRSNATSVGIDVDLDRVLKMFYRIGLSRNQMSVYEAQLAAETLKMAYAVSKTVCIKGSKVFNRSTLAAFMLAWQTANTSENKHFALNKWKVFNAGPDSSVKHEDDIHTNYMHAVRDAVKDTTRNAWEPAFLLFKQAYNIFLPGSHHNKKNFTGLRLDNDKFKELVIRCLDTTA
jgi:hypothetical protein